MRTNTLQKQKSLQIVCYDRGWILEAIAKQWHNYFLEHEEFSKCSLVYKSPEPGYDIYIHFVWFDAVPVKGARNIMFVTHLDHWWKVVKIIQQARNGCEFVCMSSQTSELISKYTGTTNARHIIPQPLHFENHKVSVTNQLTYGMFFRVQEDGRKSDKDIIKVLEFANNNPDCCHLILFGDGFAELIKPYKKIVASVYSEKFDEIYYRKQMEQCDYVLYFGFDEGAISVLDAATLGIPVLATRQGYHLDLMLPKGSILFDSSADVVNAVTNSACAIRNKKRETGLQSYLFDVPLKFKKPSLTAYIKVPFVNNIFIKNTKHLLQDLKVILKIILNIY